jgi:hypothetical protein
MIANESAILAAHMILRQVRGAQMPDDVLLQRITSIVLDAIKAAGPAPVPELYPGQNAQIQQALATIDAARLHRHERMLQERAANDRRQGEERRGVLRQDEQQG